MHKLELRCLQATTDLMLKEGYKEKHLMGLPELECTIFLSIVAKVNDLGLMSTGRTLSHVCLEGGRSTICEERSSLGAIKSEHF